MTTGSCRRILLALLLLLAVSQVIPAQKKAAEDNVFRLVQAERAEQYERFGMHYRLVKGHARFLHNDTYLLCDSASWNVDSRFIEAYGNVQVIQNNTMLKSDQMHYWIDENRAAFRGSLVELLDKDGNTLRTTQLNYNTKDSVAVFESGGSLKDKDGGVIEGRRGTYDAKEGLFTFEDRVELYMDSIEVKSQTLRYLSDEDRAYFGKNTYMWRDNGFLRADAGWYDRGAQTVFFTDHVYMFDPSYDVWADELYYRQTDGAVDLYRNAQVLDTVNQCIYMGGHIQYTPARDSVSERGTMTDDPAIVYYGENENHVVDTLYARADTFFVYAVPRCDIPEEEVSEAGKRREDIEYDALGKKRAEEAVTREEERIKKLREVGKLPPEWVEKQQQATADSLASLSRLDSLVALGAIDSLVASADSIRASRHAVDSLIRQAKSLDTIAKIPPALEGGLDSTATAPRESTEAIVARDTTPIRYVHAWNNVKLYRSDLQAACDSLVFTELDSIVRLFGSPVLWNEVRNQLSADEMNLLMKNGSFERGSMITNAWLISQQDTAHYDQIKSTEMQGWFRDNKLYRFDALGGVSAIFYMADEGVLTTINVKESKSLTAAIKDGTASRLFYVESIKSDVYPVGELVPEKQRLKDFNWRGDERPLSPDEITTQPIKTSERPQYKNVKKPLYRETNRYFDNYMIDLFERLDAEKIAAAERKKAEQDSIAAASALLDSVERDHPPVLPDTVAVVSSERPDSTETVVPAALERGEQVVAADSTMTVMSDTTATVMPDLTGHLDSAAVAIPVHPDSAAVVPVPIEKPKEAEAVTPASPETVVVSKELTRAEKRALRRAERQARREARRAARQARREARRAARKAAKK